MLFILISKIFNFEIRKKWDKNLKEYIELEKNKNFTDYSIVKYLPSPFKARYFTEKIVHTYSETLKTDISIIYSIETPFHIVKIIFFLNMG